MFETIMTEPKALIYNNFLSASEIGLLSHEFDKQFKNPIKNRIIFNNSVCEMKKKRLSQVCELKTLKDRLQGVIQANTNYDVTFRKLWLVHTKHKDSDITKLPYIPHIDKKRYLKCMIYITNVELKHGPLHLTQSSMANLEEFRLSNTKNSDNYNITDSNIDKAIPLCAPSGTLIIFDTNTPHFAGFIDEGKSRRIARFDFEQSGWNKKTIKETVKDFIGI